MIDLLHAPPTRESPWAAQRRLPRASDEALTGTTRVWLRKLPPGRRPLRLCCRFPRVANRIAWCWAETLLVEQVFDDLLLDRRGGRRGFPRLVVTELRRLREFRDNPRSALLDVGVWASLKRLLGTD